MHILKKKKNKKKNSHVTSVQNEFIDFLMVFAIIPTSVKIDRTWL